MGTLTADCPRLDTHCPHKLATSCRLTSTPNCCACADERPHSRTYSVYIDGVGFVQRGTRWQSYCWFCKEFWNNRLAATEPPLELWQTRIPDIPDQTQFLERWFEFHQGYRIVKDQNGTEQRIAVIGEDLRDVSPGLLPRTLDQLRARTANDPGRAENRFRRRRLSSEEEASTQQPQQSIEDALDSLLETVSDEEEEAEFRRPPPTHTEELAQRTRERFVRVFGTQEEIAQDDYVSPIASLYVRAWQRYRQTEERRSTAGSSLPEQLEMPHAGVPREVNSPWALMAAFRDRLYTSSHEDDSDADDMPDVIEGQPPPRSRPHLPPSVGAPPIITPARRISMSRQREMLQGSSREMFNNMRAGREPLRHGPAPELDMDKQNRPPPLREDQLTRTLACRVCYTQLAEFVLIPCGHLVLCQWCADATIPVKHSHYPINPSNCPVCRKLVRERYKIHT